MASSASDDVTGELPNESTASTIDCEHAVTDGAAPFNLRAYIDDVRACLAERDRQRRLAPRLYLDSPSPTVQRHPAQRQLRWDRVSTGLFSDNDMWSDDPVISESVSTPPLDGWRGDYIVVSDARGHTQ
jgi:hypothetical protein